MRSFSVICIALLCFSLSFSQNRLQFQILDKFISAHNNGSELAISNFIKDTYHPDLYSKIDVKAHINYYKDLISEFGPLNSAIYSVNEQSPLKLVVQLIKKGENIRNKYIDPTDILVVEIELNEKDPSFLNRGLELGSLVYEQEEH